MDAFVCPAEQSSAARWRNPRNQREIVRGGHFFLVVVPLLLRPLLLIFLFLLG
jgi:hypothetical protein